MNYIKYAIAVIVGIVLGFVGYGLLHLSVAGSGSPVGTTNAAPRVAQVVCNNTATTTFASFYNNDASDRIVTTVDYFLTGFTSTSGLSYFQLGTSTVAVGTSSTNFVYYTTQATTTDPIYVSTSTPTAGTLGTASLASANRIWAAGSYLNLVANTTTPGYCVVRIGYIPE